MVGDEVLERGGDLVAIGACLGYLSRYLIGRVARPALGGVGSGGMAPERWLVKISGGLMNGCKSLCDLSNSTAKAIMTITVTTALAKISLLTKGARRKETARRT